MSRRSTSAVMVENRPSEAGELLAAALTLAARRRRLEHQRELLTAETDAVVLELCDDLGVPAIRVAELLGVSAQRMSQLLADARRRRDSAEQ